jgi:predicted small lipoprotein YifL
MNNLLKILIIVTACVSLTACGIKGDLSLPEETEGQAYEH